MPALRTRAPRLAALPLVLLLLLPALAPRLALAHTGLRRSDPARGARVAPELGTLRLWFTERVPVAITRVRLVGPDSVRRALQVRADSADPTLIIAAVAGPLDAGTWRVEWSTGGRDGHPVRGRFEFVVESPTPAAIPASRDSVAAPAPPPPRGGAFNATLDSMMRDRADMPHERIESGGAMTEYRVARWAEFVGLLAALGAIAFHWLMSRRLRAQGFDLLARDASDGARQVAIGALVLLVAAALVRLYGEASALAGPDASPTPGAVLALLTETAWGRGWQVGIAAACLAVIGVVAARRAAWGWTLALVGGVGLALGPALTGHAIATRDLPVVAVAADFLHVAGAAAWLGALLVVLLAGLPAVGRRPEEERGASADAMLATFHPLAKACVPLVLASGLVSGWLRVRSLDALTHTSYGSLLLYKAFVFLFAALVGFYNWRKVLPRMRASGGAARLRRSATVELLVGAIVLALTAALVATEPPDMAQPGAPITSFIQSR